jgi:hypothetical protein
MKIGIMQPYLFPYIGYFQLMNYVDSFVVYDNIEYTKKGWINRNRILVNNSDSLISFPLKKDSDFLYINQRFLSDNWNIEKKNLLNKITGAYKKAQNFSETFAVLEKILNFENTNLFDFTFNSLNELKAHLKINTPFIVSSEIQIDHSLKSESKVIALCKALNASSYINPIGGLDLYNFDNFQEAGLDLSFIKTSNVIYPQFKEPFVPMLSIIDVMMFNSVEKISEFLNTGFDLINKSS